MHTNRKRFAVSAILLAAMFAAVSPLRAQDDSKASSEKEQELLAVLRSDAPPQEKALTCKQLAIYGSSAAVAELAKLLPDPQLSSWGRIALEAIPGSEANEALRQAATSLEGNLLIGVINSIGVREDAEAVELLNGHLKSPDAEIASAAAVALGNIGNNAATQSLRAALAEVPADVRSAVAEGCVLCAERLLAAGNSAQAIEIYDQVRQADLPQQRVIEATRGAIVARGEDGIPLLLEQFRSADKRFFQLALGLSRELPGIGVDKALADLLADAAADRAALIIQAMADRPQTVVLPAIVQAAAEGPLPVRLSAIHALGRVGDVSCLETLLEIAQQADSELGETARQSLATVGGQKVDAQIVASLADAQGQTYALLLELVGQRRIDAVPQVLPALEDSDAAVRRAALVALGQTISLPRLSVLIAQVVSPKTPEDAQVAQQALRAACVRIPDRQACVTELTQALQRVPSETKTFLLEIVSEVGGAQALQTLAAAAKSDTPELQDAGSRLLGRWNGLDAAPVLLDLAKTAPENRYQVRALRGYIGLARKFDMSDQQRGEMCRNAVNVARQSAEKQLVLEVLQLHPSVEGLKLATELLSDTELKPAATQATLVIAQKLGKQADVTELLSKAGFERVKLEIIKAEYGAGSSKKDVTEVLRKHTSDLPLIVLPSTSYNTSFGGDPAPGTVKQLQVTYRIDGKQGEVSFAENDPLFFPTPD